MKFRHLLPAVVAAGALMISGVASATLIYQWQGSGTDWSNSADGGTAHSIVDDGVAWPHPPNGTATPSGDGDTTFTLNSNSFDSGTQYTIQEQETNGLDLYNVGLDFSGTTNGAVSSGSLGFTVSTTDPGGLSSAFLDSIRTPGALTNVTKQLYTSYTDYLAGASPFLTLSSIDGSSDSGSFASRQSFFVLDTVNTGSIEDIHNHFIPDPGTLSLLGIGMVGLGARRRMIKKAKA